MGMSNIAIVIPTYNRPAKLKRALASCFAQTTRPAQIIVVDNGSNPDTQKVVQEFQAQHGERVAYCQSEPFKGRAALATGLAKVQEDWVILLDDDDFLVTDRVENDLKTIESVPEEVILIAHDFVRTDFQTHLVWLHRLAPEKLTLESALGLDHFGPPPAATWRASVVKRHHPFHFDEGWFDYDLIASALQHGRAVASGRVGYIMDDTRAGVRETTSSDKPVRLVLLHGERYEKVPAQFGLDPARVKKRISEQAAFYAGKILGVRAWTSPYAPHVRRHPVEFMKGRLAPLRLAVTKAAGRFLPEMRGAKTYPLAQFAVVEPKLAGWIEVNANPAI